ncbi:chorismate-binding protein [Kaistella antarctica]|uniref:Isochorismate synthase n=1 Tax=Kaistella antarctica TaxID=266748 RepID=A0A448NV49_9FLAO|nr:chorismate-binding protein [Kaistella antarctica]KEY20244.1 isochorismate synthase [Kaistella antarctica]SEV91916.1 isochorismate synthase [Kaistella antarctica]VEI01672.1 Isochorismate synthase entC [Kaistella antarctica]
MLYFRFPFSDEIFTTDDSSAQNAVSFVSFDGLNELNFKGEIKEVPRDTFLAQGNSMKTTASKLCVFRPETKKDYEQKINKVINFVKNENLSKLVISRRKLVSYEGSKPNFSKTFLNLCEAYPNAFVYFFTKNNQSWMGAFSEVLGSFNKKTLEFETMSLAGTTQIDETWTRKELAEQRHVTDYISNILKDYSVDVTKSETYDHPSGNIKHLRTDFKAKIKSQDLEKIIAELHPTPAVCGFPKKFCQQAIAKFEEHRRSFYAGYIKVETAETIQYFVNLRCAEFFQNVALIYVGGGITAESSSEKEWQETELKAEAILKNLSFF